MLYFTTGANGTGKTLLTLKLVKELADRESRPVCHNGRFDPVPGGPLSNWKRIDFKDWQAEPDGTIFFVDECHNDLPLRPSSEKPPEYVRMLAEHRKRGFDFFLISQHPQNVDVFVRRLIGNPGWHRHLKRVAGASIVSQLQWDAVNPNCEKPGAGNSGEVKMVAFPQEVYGWYRSAQLHTGKVKIPRAVWVLAACALLVPVLGWFGYRTVTKNIMGRGDAVKAGAAPGASAAGFGPAPMRSEAKQAPLTPAQYAALRAPRFEGFPHTAPAYDEVTKPSVAPYPAACLEGVRPGTGKRSCGCWSQQGTVLRVPEDVCVQIVRNGFFIDWHQEQAQGRASELAPGGLAGKPSPELLAGPMPVVGPEAVALSEVAEHVQPVARAPGPPAPTPPPAVGPAPARGGHGFRR